MRAIVQETIGGPEVLRIAEVPMPEPGPTEVLVKVHAAGVNPVDWKVRASGAFIGPPRSRSAGMSPASWRRRAVA